MFYPLFILSERFGNPNINIGRTLLLACGVVVPRKFHMIDVVLGFQAPRDSPCCTITNDVGLNHSYCSPVRCQASHLLPTCRSTAFDLDKGLWLKKAVSFRSYVPLGLRFCAIQTGQRRRWERNEQLPLSLSNQRSKLTGVCTLLVNRSLQQWKCTYSLPLGTPTREQRVLPIKTPGVHNA